MASADEWSYSASFRIKLAKLTAANDSITALSRWVQFHSAHAPAAAALWAQEALEAGERGLLLVYLANDVIQNSKRKGTACAGAFGAEMARVLPQIHARAPPTVRAKLERIVAILDERAVLPAEQIETMKQEIAKAPAAAKTSTAVDHAATATATVPLPAERQPLKRARPAGESSAAAAKGEQQPLTLTALLDELGKCTAVHRLAAERERNLDVVAIEQGEADAGEVRKSLALLTEQVETLKHELDARRALVLTLALAVETQHALCERLAVDLAECEAFKERIEVAKST